MKKQNKKQPEKAESQDDKISSIFRKTNGKKQSGVCFANKRIV